MKKAIKIIVLALALLPMSSCVNKFKQIEITSAAIESVTPKGLKKYDAVVALGVKNPAPAFNLMNLKADVYRDSTAILHLTGENVAVAGRTEKVYKLPVSAQIDSSVTLMQLAILARKFKPEEYTVDVSARAVVGGVGKNLYFSGMSLASLMEKASK